MSERAIPWECSCDPNEMLPLDDTPNSPPWCAATWETDSGREWACTMRRGHTGPHRAGDYDFICAEWE